MFVSHSQSDCTIGIGSGSTMTYVLSRIVERCREKSLSVKCVPTSFQSKQLIYDYKLPVTELDYHHELDVTIDGADEVSEHLVAIKGGGACLAQEKVVAAAAKKFVVVADYRKDSKKLGDNWKKGIPIEVLPMACNVVRHKLSGIFNIPIDDLKVRIGKEKAGPVITDNGNMVIDWKFIPDTSFSHTVAGWKSLARNIKLIPGVVETGIFADMIEEAYFGMPDGTVTVREKELLW